MSTRATNIFVYGQGVPATFAAVAAKTRPSSNGYLDVVLAHPERHPGGPLSNGLSAIDYGRYAISAIGTWLAATFHNKLTLFGGSPTRILRDSPSVCERALRQMQNEAGVIRLLDPAYRVVSVTKTGTVGGSATFTNGDTVTFDAWCDASEEGDLMALMGCSYRTGREASAEYGESNAGFFPIPSSFTPFDCFDGSGNILNGFAPYPSLLPGDADNTHQAPGFRLCVSGEQMDRIGWPKPSGYDPTLFEYRRRGIPAGLSGWRPYFWGACLSGKGDVNNDYGLGYMDAWSVSDLATRTALFQKMYAEQAGWYWFLANDPSIDPTVQAYVRANAPCRSEFQDTSGTATPYGGTGAGWPHMPYIRVNRRLVGQHVMKQDDLQGNATKTDSIAVGFYSMDCHPHQKLIYVQDGVPGYINDGFGQTPVQSDRAVTPGYQEPFRAMRPLASESTNGIVTVASSSSYVAHCSRRIDMQKAAVSAAGGLALAKSVQTGVALDALSIPDLQAELVAKGHPISFSL